MRYRLKVVGWVTGCKCVKEERVGEGDEGVRGQMGYVL